MRQVENEFGQVEHFHVYILVRQDLSFEQQTVQSCHSIIEATKAFEQPIKHPSLVICSVKDEFALEQAISYIQSRNINLVEFREPDIGNQLTAIATEPISQEKRRIFSKYPLLKRGCDMI